MFQTLQVLEQRRVISSKPMKVARVKCLSCGTEREMLLQNASKANRKGSARCSLCPKAESHRLRSIWRGMKRRCTEPQDPSFRNYGGRGIKFCDRWRDFWLFCEDMNHGYSEGLTLERVDVNGDYCPENCTWTTPFAQQSNKRNNRLLTFRGESMTLANLCRRTRISKTMLCMRLDRGMSADEAVADAIASPRMRKLHFRGQQMHLAEICRASGVGKTKLQARLARGMTPDEAVAHALAGKRASWPTSTTW